MVNVRDYLKKREKRESDKPRISYREKIKSHKFTIFYRMMLAIILIAAIGAATYIQWKNKVYTESLVVASA